MKDLLAKFSLLAKHEKGFPMKEQKMEKHVVQAWLSSFANRMWFYSTASDVGFTVRTLTDWFILLRHHLNLNGTVGQMHDWCFKQKKLWSMYADFGPFSEKQNLYNLSEDDDVENIYKLFS